MKGENTMYLGFLVAGDDECCVCDSCRVPHLTSVEIRRNDHTIIMTLCEECIKELKDLLEGVWM
jgi:hypothetical protein